MREHDLFLAGRKCKQDGGCKANINLNFPWELSRYANLDDDDTNPRRIAFVSHCFPVKLAAPVL
jgi:hypothetical protein